MVCSLTLAELNAADEKRASVLSFFNCYKLTYNRVRIPNIICILNSLLFFRWLLFLSFSLRRLRRSFAHTTIISAIEKKVLLRNTSSSPISGFAITLSISLIVAGMHEMSNCTWYASGYPLMLYMLFCNPRSVT